MKSDKKEKNGEELDQIEETLIREDIEKRKLPMPVSGRSIFEIKRIKDEKGEKKK